MPQGSQRSTRTAAGAARARKPVAKAPANGQVRSAKGARTRGRLLDAAKTVFERDGFLNARIADIADAAGMSHGSFYHYFDSKEQIFREVAEAQEISLLTLSPAEGASRDPVERIRAANRAYLRAYVDSAKIMRVIEEVSRYDDEIRAVRAKRDNEFAERLRSAIERLQADGAADERIDGWYAANALGCMVGRFAEMFVRQGDFDFEVAVEQLTLLWAQGIGLRVRSSPSAPAKRTAARRPAAKR
jgi:AcrR family transcriptional regulator